MAEIVRLSTIDLFGGGRVIIARVQYEALELEITFTGSQKGRPGHVRCIVENDNEVPVPFPERYGDAFNEDWVRTYWARNMKEES